MTACLTMREPPVNRSPVLAIGNSGSALCASRSSSGRDWRPLHRDDGHQAGAGRRRRRNRGVRDRRTLVSRPIPPGTIRSRWPRPTTLRPRQESTYPAHRCSIPAAVAHGSISIALHQKASCSPSRQRACPKCTIGRRMFSRYCSLKATIPSSRFGSDACSMRRTKSAPERAELRAGLSQKLTINRRHTKRPAKATRPRRARVTTHEATAAAARSPRGGSGSRSYLVDDLVSRVGAHGQVCDSGCAKTGDHHSEPP